MVNEIIDLSSRRSIAAAPSEPPAITITMAQHLIAARCDLSDKTECFYLLYAMQVADWRVISNHLEAAIYEAGQHWIAQAISAAE